MAYSSQTDGVLMLDPPTGATLPTVLVVEDEALVRMVAVAMLTDDGFAVIEAFNADEALEILATQADDIHLLFTDVQMPGSMNGWGLIERVRRQWPWIGFLVTSGNKHPEGKLPAGCRFVAKPYNFDHIGNQLRGLAGEK
jgi:CheY-like chemotaxis protein